MINHLTEIPQQIVIIGDAFVASQTIETAIRNSQISVGKVTHLFWGTDDEQEFTIRQLNLERNGPEAENYAAGLDDVIEDANIIVTHFCPLPKKLLERAGRLQAIFTCRSGLEHIDVDQASKMNIPVINVIRNAEAVADFTLGMIIALTRNIAFSHHGIITGDWPKTFSNSEHTTTLSKLTVGIAGIGNIGTILARNLDALKVPLIIFDEYVSKGQMEKKGLGHIKMASSLQDIFKEADVVSIHLRLSDSNTGLIGRDYFDLMKPNAYFINVARGGLINQNDLAAALEQKKIAGAALDVFDAEPLPQNSRLIKLDNVLMTSHIAGATMDAIPQSPNILFSEADKIFLLDMTERIVNISRIKI